MIKDIEYLKKYYNGDIKEAEEKLKQNYPLQYIIGNVDFYGYQINVDENVLIPRFETEQLVEKTINLIKQYSIKQPKILDIACGSGCIAITLKKEIQDSKVWALDYKDEVLTKAKENITLNNVDIDLQKVDILKENLSGEFDVIISNPPYVDKDESVDIKTKYEPQDAIFADKNGLIFYEHIAKKAKYVLNKKSIIALEIGYNQKDQVIQIFRNNFPKAKIYCEKDYNNFDRFVFVLNNYE